MVGCWFALATRRLLFVIEEVIRVQTSPGQAQVRILEDRSGVVLHGLEEVHVKSANDIFQLLDQGSAKRRTAETLLNKQSSRSHSVFTVTVSIRCGGHV